MNKDPFLFKYVDGSTCYYCDLPTRRVLGHRPDMPTPDVFYCPGCGAFVTALASDTDAMGSVAGPKLRGLRQSVHTKALATVKLLLDEHPHVSKAHIRWCTYDTLGMMADVPRTFRYVSMFREAHCLKALAVKDRTLYDMAFMIMKI